MQTHPLTAFRESRQISKTDLADQLGVSCAAVSRWEAGERWPSYHSMIRIKEVTGITHGDILSYREGVA